jgi:cysteinyl-tRNA synthetase
MLQLFNSLSKQKETFVPLDQSGKEVKMYTCGPTVYNYAHIGNFFAYLSADTLHRWLKFGENYQVKWVMNITDIDDKTIRDSKTKYPQLNPKEALGKLCHFYAQEFLQDLSTLNIPPSSFLANPRATEYIPAQQDLIQKLYDQKYAYVSEGSVYFNIQAYKKDHKYGRLVKIDEGFQAGARVDQDEYTKESAADFVLWKGKKEDEPFWEFQLDDLSLPGRPGWHLECSAMEKELLGLPFDIHTGGTDLKFPHHEDEIAQSLGGYGIDPTKYWVHNGYLMVEGEKMSKSKNNFFRLADLVKKQGIEPEVFRFLMVTNHYRKNFNFTKNGIHAAKKNLAEIRETYHKILEIKTKTDKSPVQLKKSKEPEAGKTGLKQKFTDDQLLIKNLKNDFYTAMRNDLNTPQALAVLLKFTTEVRHIYLKDSNAMKKELFEDIINFFNFCANIFGINLKNLSTEIPANIIKLAEQREKARAAQDWSKADTLRDLIDEKGFYIKDNSTGYKLSEK